MQGPRRWRGPCCIISGLEATGEPERQAVAVVVVEIVGEDGSGRGSAGTIDTIVSSSRFIGCFTLQKVLDDEAGEGETKDGGDVRHGAVDLGFGGAPFVVQQVGTAVTRLVFGTHAGFGAASARLPQVG